MAFTKSDLRYEVMATGSHFFDRSTMRFFGDTMANYGITHHKLTEVYELRRLTPVKHGLSSSAFFDDQNFEHLGSKSPELRVNR